jgi:outer membrane protein assembly factor BamB
MYRGDLARDGHPFYAALDASGASRLGLAWRAHLPGAVDGTPAVAHGLVIAGSAAGELRAVNAATGETVWSRHGLGAITGSATVSGDRVFVGSLTGHLYAMDATSGHQVWDWKGPAGAAVWASPVALGDEVIVGVASPYGGQPLVPGRLYGLDAADGRQRWSLCVEINCAAGGGIWSTPSIDEEGNAFVGVGNPVDGVLAFDPLTGEEKWLGNLYADAGRDLDVGASPVIYDLSGEEVVAQASVEGLLAVLDAGNGGLVWQRQLVDGVAVHGLLATPAYDRTNLFVASASPSVGVFALKPSDGTTVWRHPTDHPVYSAPAVGKGVLVFGTGAVLEDVKAGSIVVLSTSDGSVLFAFDTHSAVRSGPAIAGSLVVAGDAAGDLFAFRPKG